MIIISEHVEPLGSNDCYKRMHTLKREVIKVTCVYVVTKLQLTNFRKEQKMLEDRKRRAEQEVKQRRIQEQQKRLKEFSAIGGRKMDADSLIESIIGPKSGGNRPPTTGPPGVAPPSYSAAMQQIAVQNANGVPPQPGMVGPAGGIGNMPPMTAPIQQRQ